MIFIISYLVYGGMLLYSITELMLLNAWINIFEFKQVTSEKTAINKRERNITRITYEFKYNGKTHYNWREVNNEIVETKLPKNINQLQISFNTLFPQVNYIEDIGLKTRSGNIGMVISGFLLFFTILIDLFGNKKKWLRLYGLEK
ncbi:MAG: hypothetical protein WBB36_14320 [Chitinophagales bacterium]